jgi:hypothetical protein
MPLNPEMRASDQDRDKVAAVLREHMAAGRLTADELEERLDSTYKAKTMGDLQLVTQDLPEEDLHQRPVPSYQRSHSVPASYRRQRGGGLYQSGLRVAWGSWASVSMICTLIWVLTMVGNASWEYPWPIWVAGPWGAILLAGTLFGPDKDERGR